MFCAAYLLSRNFLHQSSANSPRRKVYINADDISSKYICKRYDAKVITFT